jgi:hypothetical protein
MGKELEGITLVNVNSPRGLYIFLPLRYACKCVQQVQLFVVCAGALPRSKYTTFL